MNTQTYYDILEISQSASQHEIAAAYHKAKDTYAIDSPALYTIFSKEEAKELMTMIEEAYTILGNECKRAQYDQQIKDYKEAPGFSQTAPKTENINIPENEFPEFDLPSINMPGSPLHSTGTNEDARHLTPQASSEHPIDFNQATKPQFTPTTQPAVELNHEELFLQNNQAPPGFKKTNFGIYEYDEIFEIEIDNQTMFDGTFLQRVRLYKNISAEQVIQTIKISRAYLSSVESNEYDKLPALVFVRGFVVQIAKLLNLDANKVASSYLELMKLHKN